MDNNKGPLDSPSPSIVGQELLTNGGYTQPDTATIISPLDVPPPAPIPLTGEQAKARSERYQFAAQNMPDQDFDKGLFTGQILSGRDTELRNQYAAFDSIRKQRLNDDDTRRILQTRLPAEPLTPEDMARIKANSLPVYSNPKTVFERSYAEEMVAHALGERKTDGSGHVLGEAAEENPSAAELTTKYAKEAIAKQAYVTKKIEEVQEELKNSNVAYKTIDFALGFIPSIGSVAGYKAFRDAGGDAILLGTDRKQQMDYFYGLKDDEYAEKLDQVVERMGANSITIEFLHDLLQYSSSDEWWHNYVQPIINTTAAFPGLVTKPVGAAARAVAKTEAAQRLSRALQRTVGATAAPNVTPNQVSSALGNVGPPAASTARRLADEAMGNAPRLSTMQQLGDEAMTVFNPAAVAGGPSNALSRPLAQRLSTILTDGARRFQEELLGKRLHVDRLTGDYSEASFRQAEELLRLQYRYAADSIIDVRPSPIEKDVVNVDWVEGRFGKNVNPPMPMPAGAYNPKLPSPGTYMQKYDIVFGKTDAQFFDTVDQANNYAKYNLKLKEYQLEQIGDNKFAIIVTKPVDETTVAGRTALEIQTAHATPQAMKNMYLGWLRGRKRVIPEELYNDAVVATYGSSALLKLAEDLYQPVGKLSRREFRDLERFLEFQRDHIDQTTGLRGRWSPTIGEFERDWQALHGVLPTEKQTRAYYVHTQISDMDWIMRNLSVYTAKSRKGVERFVFDNAGFAGDYEIEGRILQQLPLESNTGFNVLVLNEDTVATQQGLGHSRFLRAENRQAMRDAIEAGDYYVIQLTQDGQRALRAVPELEEMLEGHTINFVLANSIKTRPLALKQIPHRPGGHVEYTNGSYFMRQPITRVMGSGQNRYRIYEGDTTILAFDSQAQAEHWLPIYEEARRIYEDVQAGILQDFHLNTYINQHLPHSPAEFRRMFTRDGAGLDVHTPLYVTKKGDTVDSVVNLANEYKHEPWQFINEPRSEHNIMGPEDVVKYTGERDNPLLTIEERGSPSNPVVNFRPASLIDPGRVMQEAMNSAVRGRYFDDLKYKYAEHFLAEFGDVLEPSFKEAIRDPIRGLINAQFKDNFTNRTRLAAAKNYRSSVINLLALKSDGQRDFDWVRQSLANSIYTHLGQQRLDLVAPWLIDQIEDPTTYLKQFAFHAKMGLFNPKQFFLQASGFIHVAAIDGVSRANKAMGAGTMMQAADWANPKIVEALADKMEGLGWKREHWLESYRALEKSGFGHVGRELSTRDALMAPKLRKSGPYQILDWGSSPFNAGERITRYTAWNAAYLRWREMHPNRTFNAAAQKEVLARADVLIANMSSAGNASWQYGLKSLPSQFFSYRARMMEQFLSKDLTRQEKMRLFGTYSLLYGIPVASVIPVAVLPVNEIFKDWLRDWQQYPADNMITETLTDGMLSMITRMITGEDTNIETVFGPGPITQFHDLWNYTVKGKSDKTLGEIMGGATGTFFADMAEATTPFFRSIRDSLTDKRGVDNRITTQDLIDLLKPFSSASQAVKAYLAYNYGIFYTKNQGVLTKVDDNANAAILVGVLGLEPQAIEDSYRKMQDITAAREVKKKQEKEATKYYRLGFEALRNKQADEAQRYFELAGTAMDLAGFTPDERARAFSNVTKNYQSTIESIDWMWAKQSYENMQAFRRQQRIEQERKQ